MGFQFFSFQLKGNQTEEANWSENVENVQIFLLVVISVFTYKKYYFLWHLYMYDSRWV